jgi:hypothetical protein
MKYNQRVDVEGFRQKQAEEENKTFYEQLNKFEKLDRKMQKYEESKKSNFNTMMDKRHDK